MWTQEAETKNLALRLCAGVFCCGVLPNKLSESLSSLVFFRNTVVNKLALFRITVVLFLFITAVPNTKLCVVVHYSSEKAFSLSHDSSALPSRMLTIWT